MLAALTLLYLVTFLLTKLLTNADAAALVVPTALEVATSLGTHPLPFALVFAVAASPPAELEWLQSTCPEALGEEKGEDTWETYKGLIVRSSSMIGLSGRLGRAPDEP